MPFKNPIKTDKFDCLDTARFQSVTKKRKLCKIAENSHSIRPISSHEPHKKFAIFAKNPSKVDKCWNPPLKDQNYKCKNENLKESKNQELTHLALQETVFDTDQNTLSLREDVGDNFQNRKSKEFEERDVDSCLFKTKGETTELNDCMNQIKKKKTVPLEIDKKDIPKSTPSYVQDELIFNSTKIKSNENGGEKLQIDENQNGNILSFLTAKVESLIHSSSKKDKESSLRKNEREEFQQSKIENKGTTNTIKRANNLLKRPEFDLAGSQMVKTPDEDIRLDFMNGGVQRAFIETDKKPQINLIDWEGNQQDKKILSKKNESRDPTQCLMEAKETNSLEVKNLPSRSKDLFQDLQWPEFDKNDLKAVDTLLQGVNDIKMKGQIDDKYSLERVDSFTKFTRSEEVLQDVEMKNKNLKLTTNSEEEAFSRRNGSTENCDPPLKNMRADDTSIENELNRKTVKLNLEQNKLKPSSLIGGAKKNSKIKPFGKNESFFTSIEPTCLRDSYDEMVKKNEAGEKTTEQDRNEIQNQNSDDDLDEIVSKSIEKYMNESNTKQMDTNFEFLGESISSQETVLLSPMNSVKSRQNENDDDNYKKLAESKINEITSMNMLNTSFVELTEENDQTKQEESITTQNLFKNNYDTKSDFENHQKSCFTREDQRKIFESFQNGKDSDWEPEDFDTALNIEKNVSRGEVLEEDEFENSVSSTKLLDTENSFKQLIKTKEEFFFNSKRISTNENYDYGNFMSNDSQEFDGQQNDYLPVGQQVKQKYINSSDRTLMEVRGEDDSIIKNVPSSKCTNERLRSTTNEKFNPSEMIGDEISKDKNENKVEEIKDPKMTDVKKALISDSEKTIFIDLTYDSFSDNSMGEKTEDLIKSCDEFEKADEFLDNMKKNKFGMLVPEDKQPENILDCELNVKNVPLKQIQDKNIFEEHNPVQKKSFLSFKELYGDEVSSSQATLSGKIERLNQQQSTNENYMNQNNILRTHFFTSQSQSQESNQHKASAEEDPKKNYFENRFLNNYDWSRNRVHFMSPLGFSNSKLPFKQDKEIEDGGNVKTEILPFQCRTQKNLITFEDLPLSHMLSYSGPNFFSQKLISNNSMELKDVKFVKPDEKVKQNQLQLNSSKTSIELLQDLRTYLNKQREEKNALIKKTRNLILQAKVTVQELLEIESKQTN